MNTNRILAAVIVVMAGASVVLAHRLWTDHRRLEALHAQAPEPGPPLASQAAASGPADASSPLQTAGPLQTSGAPPSATAPPKGSFRDLPAWLPVPMEQRDTLFELQSVLTMRSGLTVGTSRVAVEAREREESHQRQAAQHLQRLLGPTLYPLWKEYHDNYPARARLARMSREPGIEAVPEDTIRVMAAAMTRATQSVEMEWQATPGNRPDHESPATAEEVDKRTAKRRQMSEVSRDVAQRYLSRSQLDAFDKAQARELAILAENAAVTKAMLKYDASAAKPAR